MTSLSEFKTVDSNYFIFPLLICCFSFFYFYLWGLRIRVKCDITVTLPHISHMTWSQSYVIGKSIDVKIIEGGLCSFLFSLFYFYFSFFFYSLFLFLEQLRLGVISHAVTSVTT